MSMQLPWEMQQKFFSPPQKFLGMDIGQQSRVLQQPQNALLRGIHARRMREIGAPRESLSNRYHLEMLGEMRELRRGSSERITNVG